MNRAASRHVARGDDGRRRTRNGRVARQGIDSARPHLECRRGTCILTMMDLALRQAQRSLCRQRVGAVLARGSRVLVASPNRRRNSPEVTVAHATFHAEEAVLRRAVHTDGATVYVARVDATGQPRLAKPCIRCHQALIASGITRVYYTAGPDSVESLDLSLSDFYGSDPFMRSPWMDARSAPVGYRYVTATRYI
ncbi:hypothetical protein [Streptomyces sp. NPDC029554]|uniref:deaminase n=1 Tax=Streptomyces sp. NPDC029554 TaxID=3155126 RepID=UPI0033C00419